MRGGCWSGEDQHSGSSRAGAAGRAWFVPPHPWLQAPNIADPHPVCLNPGNGIFSGLCGTNTRHPMLKTTLEHRAFVVVYLQNSLLAHAF